MENAIPLSRIPLGPRGKGPFWRMRRYLAALNAIHLMPVTMRQPLLAELGSYRSRGHGEGLLGNKHSRRCVAQDKRDARRARNRRTS